MTTPLAAARALAPRLRAGVEPGEAAGALPDDLVDALWDAGLFMMLSPHELGGGEVDDVVAVEAIEEIARHNASAAWVVAQCANHAFWIAALTAPEVLETFWRPGDRLITTAIGTPQGKAERVAGGYRITGKYRWGSGSSCATWFLALAQIFQDGVVERDPGGAPKIASFLVPASEVWIDRGSWRVAGLAATASFDVAIDGAFVPEGRHFNHVRDRSWRPEPRYRSLDPLSIASSAVVPLGAARAALDATEAMLRVRTDPRTGDPARSLRQNQELFARGAITLASARALIYQQLRRAADVFAAGEELSAEDEGLLVGSASRAGDAALEVVNLMRELWGSESVHLACPLQRHWSDVHAATAHRLFRPANTCSAGTILLRP